jgi:arsenical pump membrane protein
VLRFGRDWVMAKGKNLVRLYVAITERWARFIQEGTATEESSSTMTPAHIEHIVITEAEEFGFDLGLATCISAAIAVLVVTKAKGKALAGIVTKISWSVLPLVAGLFVLVEAMNHAGARQNLGSAFQSCAHMAKVWGCSGCVLRNRRPVQRDEPSAIGFVGGRSAAVNSATAPYSRCCSDRRGPWSQFVCYGFAGNGFVVDRLRREGEHISAWEFLKTGLFVMPPALFLASVAISVLSG